MTYTIQVRKNGNLLGQYTFADHEIAMVVYSMEASRICNCGSEDCETKGWTVELSETTAFGGVEKIRTIMPSE